MTIRTIKLEDTLESKYDEMYYWKGRVYVAVVCAYYYITWVQEWYLECLGITITVNWDNLEDVEYIGIYIDHTHDSDIDINVCKIIQFFDKYGEDNCEGMLAITECQWCDKI